MGGYSADDVEYSSSYTSRNARDSADWELAKRRIKLMGLKGLFLQGVRKTLTNYGDGTFAWVKEGNFFNIIFDENEHPSSQFFRNLYYTGGKYFAQFCSGEQAIWLSILLLCLISAIFNKRESVAVIILSLIGLTFFNLLFEARARYMYIYAPFFVILAVDGLQQICHLTKNN